MMDEVLLDNEVDGNGVRWVHVMRMGRPVEAGEWLRLVPGEAIGIGWMQEEEEGIGAWHLWMWWRVREGVALTPRSKEGEGPSPLQDGVMWWIEEGGRLSEAMERAGTLFLAMYGRWPEAAMVRRRPKGAGEVVDVLDERVKLVEAGWVPRRCVLMVDEVLNGACTSEAVAVPAGACAGDGGEERGEEEPVAAVPVGGG